MPGHKKRRAYHEALEVARKASAGVTLNANPVDVLQEVLDRLLAQYRHASEEVDELTTEQLTVMTAFGPTDHAWVRAENRIREAIDRMAGRMIALDIAERRVNIEEAKAALLVRSFIAAARSAGVSDTQIKQIGASLRENIAEQRELEMAS